MQSGSPMNYYEEMGLTPAATADQIREAYRSLARLLHPDQQQDEELRRLADIQMKRLNAVYSVLSDPQRRRRYDASLKRASEPPLMPVMVKPPRLHHRAPVRGSQWGNLVWMAAAMVGIAGLAWYLAPQSGAYPSTAPTTNVEYPQDSAMAAAPAPDAPKPDFSGNVKPAARPDPTFDAQEAAPVQDGISAAPASPQPDAAKSAVAAAGSEPAAIPTMAASGVQLPPAVQPAADIPRSGPMEAQVPKPLEPPRRSAFSGTWFFTRVKTPAPSGMYAPEYIEAVISEDDGTVRGRYRARYRVTDKPISPDVSFYFEGRGNGSTASLHWTGGNGARGDLRLKLITENTLEVAWTATELGSSMGLASGTAVLIRRQGP